MGVVYRGRQVSLNRPVALKMITAGQLATPAAMQRFHDAERVALRALEQTDRGPAWEDARRGILDLTEGRTSLVSWKAEHGDLGHKAERALLGAALAQLTRDKLSHEQYVTLAQPMAEALPWLLPETPPEPRR